MLISHIPYSWRLLKTFLHWHLSHGDNMEVSVSHPATSESCPMAPRTQTPLCSLPCCFPSLSQSQWLMAITCAWGVTPSPPAQACLGFITHHFLAHEAAQHLVVTSAPFWLLSFSESTENRQGGKGQTTPHCAGTGLESSQKQVGSSIQQCASTKHSLFNSCLQLYMSRLPSVSCWHSRCGLQSTQKWLVKENLFLSSSPLKIWGAFPVCFHSMQMAWEITTYVVEG